MLPVVHTPADFYLYLPNVEYLPAVLDYPNFYAATSAFGSTGGNLSALAATFRETQETYGNGSYSPSVIASFLENHDNARFTNSTIDPVVRVPSLPPPLPSRVLT